jgi:hypothetical protein
MQKLIIKKINVQKKRGDMIGISNKHVCPTWDNNTTLNTKTGKNYK